VVDPGNIDYHVWFLFTAVVSSDGASTTVRLYRDGELRKSQVIQGEFLNPDGKEWTLGAEYRCSPPGAIEIDDCSQAWFGFKGRADDVRIYDRALSSGEIRALYHERGWPEVP